MAHARERGKSRSENRAKPLSTRFFFIVVSFEIGILVVHVRLGKSMHCCFVVAMRMEVCQRVVYVSAFRVGCRHGVSIGGNVD